MIKLAALFFVLLTGGNANAGKWNFLEHKSEYIESTSIFQVGQEESGVITVYLDNKTTGVDDTLQPVLNLYRVYPGLFSRKITIKSIIL